MTAPRLCGAALGALLACAVTAATPGESPAGPRSSAVAAGAPYVHWANVLARYVNDRGEVDFQGLSGDPGDLDAFVDYVARVSPGSTAARFPTRASKLAYYINSYNALAMYNVIDSDIPESLGGLRKYLFFFLKKLTIGGERLSLYAYENDFIRPLGDERVHFALNCMAVGCPRLPRAPFSAANLDAELEREARRFFAESRNVRLDHQRKVVHLSELLDFYREDFLADSPSLVAYVNRYRAHKIPPDYAVEFIDYDWTVNNQARAPEKVE